ncbi:MAG: GTPase ObgE [Helicobacter sp.]|nr:GTPase ObgE [Helicobacter sp.]
MFIDSVEIEISSGKGGNGAVSFRREKFVINGGPDGGDGGSGGNVIFKATKNAHTLSNYRGKKHFKAQNGKDGSSKNQTGKNGEDLILIVPLGTQIIDINSKKILFDFINEDKIFVVAKGGNGGFGNARFKSSTNQKPTFARNGQPSEHKKLRLELKLIADVGLVGYPNAGKSLIISKLSNTKPEIANYAFSTLIPNLGVVNISDFQNFVMADIPGIIEGASEGKGLGLEFLKHIERTKILLFVLDPSYENALDPISQLKNLQNELNVFSPALKNRPFGVVLNKIDATEKEKDIMSDLAECAKNAHFLMPISALNGANLDALKHKIFDLLEQINKTNSASSEAQ